MGYGALQVVAALLTGRERHLDDMAAELRSFTGHPYVQLTPSGRSALHLLLLSTPRPKVVVPAYTCTAVVEAARLAGKEVAYASTAHDGFNSPVSAFEPHVDADSVVVATHQFGIPCDIEPLVGLCRRRGALLVEDVAAALGGRSGGKALGTFGDAAFYSFDSTKLVNVPLKGGAISTGDSALFGRIEDAAAMLRPMRRREAALVALESLALVSIRHPAVYRGFHLLAFGARRRVTAETAEVAATPTRWYSCRMTPWQAKVGLAQLRRLDQLASRRRALYSRYLDLLEGRTALVLPPRDEHQEWAPIRFPVLVPGDKLDLYRAGVRRGVDFAFSFSHVAAPPSERRAHEVAAAVLDPPFYERLTAEEQLFVARTIRALAPIGERCG